MAQVTFSGLPLSSAVTPTNCLPSMPIGCSIKPVRCFLILAAVARQIYIARSTNVGIGSLKSHFGKKKRRGAHPPKFTKAAGKVLREVVTQLKKNGYVENYANQEGHTFGLLLTKQGRAELDKVASRIAKQRGTK